MIGADRPTDAKQALPIRHVGVWITNYPVCGKIAIVPESLRGVRAEAVVAIGIGDDFLEVQANPGNADGVGHVNLLMGCRRSLC